MPALFIQLKKKVCLNGGHSGHHVEQGRAQKQRTSKKALAGSPVRDGDGFICGVGDGDGDKS